MLRSTNEQQHIRGDTRREEETDIHNHRRGQANEQRHQILITVALFHGKHLYNQINTILNNFGQAWAGKTPMANISGEYIELSSHLQPGTKQKAEHTVYLP